MVADADPHYLFQRLIDENPGMPYAEVERLFMNAVEDDPDYLDRIIGSLFDDVWKGPHLLRLGTGAICSKKNRVSDQAGWKSVTDPDGSYGRHEYDPVTTNPRVVSFQK